MKTIVTKTKSLIFILVILLLTQSAIAANHFHLKKGDLLFQDLNCGVLCNGIDKVTRGINNTYMSHVGMVVSTHNESAIIIEAASTGVKLTPLKQFLKRSLDKNGHPRVIVERLKPQYQPLIPKAIQFAKAQLGKPYNVTFRPNHGQSYYCSQLIYTAFLHANHGKSIFHTHKMSFENPTTHKTTKNWQRYFKRLHQAPPQGLTGNNPGMMSRESALTVVYQYGKLRPHH